MFALNSNVPAFFSDLCDEIRLFMPAKKIDETDTIPQDGTCIFLRYQKEDTDWLVKTALYVDGQLRAEHSGSAPVREESALIEKKYKKRFLKNAVYELLKTYFKQSPPWGSLTGIRPTKLVRELCAQMGREKARGYFQQEFDVSQTKTRLAFDIAERQMPLIAASEAADVDIYIGIPFCKSRCSYCSFVSREYGRYTALKDEYLKCLFYEMEQAAKWISPGRVRCIYIGGGTPTALNAQELKALLSHTTACFPQWDEFTVEAGRADTIDEEKLALILRSGANRISVNAQTTNAQTLKAIGRTYPPEEYQRAFLMARRAGFSCINSDIIFGLPGEQAEMMKKTLEDVTALEPENITVHTLALKNSSYLAEQQDVTYPDAQSVAQMVEYARDYLEHRGYYPYYLYRQKYMAGNLENVGYARPGFICKYNIDIMEETTSVLALGAGGISKRLYPEQNRIERACNVKDIATYNARIKDMLARKKPLFD